MIESNIPVMIVGGGPTGLMAAAQLQRFGIEYRIIEKNPGTTAFSKALAVHARTMEIYEQMGIVHRAMEEGLQAIRATVMVNGKVAQSIPFLDVGKDLTKYPFMFVLEQSKNEMILHEHIVKGGGRVEFGSEMIEFEQQEDYATITVRNKEGELERIKADWVIAADGGSSSIRKQLNMKFDGDTYENIFYVVDTNIDWDLEYNVLYLNLSENNFTGFFPIKGGKRYRLVGILPEEFSDMDRKDVTFDMIKNDIKNVQGIDLKFGTTNWFSVYKLHHRVIDQFRLGRTFFAGDSAHVHSPAGGQGMNTGLQDAYNLCWKLAMHIKGQAHASILDSYNEERLPNAIKLVNTTDRGFSNVIKKGKLINFFKMNILPYLASKIMGFETVQRLALKTVSQIGIHYQDCSLSVGNAYIHRKAPHPGERLPLLHIYNEQTGSKQSLYDLLGEGNFNAVVWLSNKDKIANADAQNLQEMLDQKYPALFKVHSIRDITENVDAFQHLYLKKSTLYIIRPDNYIGYIGNVDDLDGLQTYLNKFLEEQQ